MPLKTRTVRPLPSFSPGVLVQRARHGTFYYNVPTEARLHAVALMILQERNEEGWFDHLKEESEADREFADKHPGMNPEEIEKLPEGPIREAGHKAWKAWRADQDRAVEDKEEWKTIEFTLKTKNGDNAWRILRQEEGGSTGVEVETCQEDPPLLPRPKKPGHGHRWTDEEGQRWIFDRRKKLGWIKGDHAQWKALYAAHEQLVLEPEIVQYDFPAGLSDASYHIYEASREKSAGEAEPVQVHPDDFKAIIEDMVQFGDHPENYMELLTDPEEAIKTGKAVFQRARFKGFTCTIVADFSEDSETAAEVRRLKRRSRRKATPKPKKKVSKKSTSKKKTSRKKTG